MLAAFRLPTKGPPVTVQVATSQAKPTKPKTSAQLRREQAETKRLVAAIPTRFDSDYAMLAALGEAVAALLERPVDWGPGRLTGHTHVVVPVADLKAIIGKLEGSTRERVLSAANRAWADAIAAMPDEYADGGAALCGCPMLAIPAIGHRDGCDILDHAQADAALLGDDVDGGTE
jgi:hypothetical protein